MPYKNLISFLLLFALMPISVWGKLPPTTTNDIAKIPLVPGPEYHPDSNSARETKKVFIGTGIALGGWPYKKFFLDIRKELLAEIDTDTMKPYYPDLRARDAMLDHITTRANEIIDTLDNETAVEAINYVGTAFITDVIHHILKAHGVGEPARREAWAKRILANFQLCTKASKHYLEADECLNTLKARVKPNIGLAVTYELSRSELAADIPTEDSKRAFLEKQTKQYTRCIREAKDVVHSLKPCVLSAMRPGIVEISKARIQIKSDEAKLPKKVGAIVVARVAPNFEKCLARAKDEKAIMICADKLVAAAGSEIVRESILRNKQFIKTIANQKSRQDIATTRAKAFSQCVGENAKNNLRGPDGSVETENCAAQALNDSTYIVVLKRLREGAEEAMEKKGAFASEAKQSLDQCWNSNQSELAKEHCLKDAIIRFSLFLASKKIESELPSQLLEQDPGIAKNGMGIFESCLNSELPKKITKAENLEEKIDLCKSKLVRSFANKAAIHLIKAKLEDVLDKDELDGFAHKLVSGGGQSFEACLGESEKYSQIDHCKIVLQKNTAIDAAKLIFPRELHAYFEKNDGLSTFPVTQEQVAEFLNSLQESHQKCLHAPFDSKSIDLAIDLCFKSSIKKFASFLGELEFTKTVSPHYVGRLEQFDAFFHSFQGKFSSCLETKAPANYTTKEYTKNVYDCGSIIATDFTRPIALDQVNFSLNTNIKSAQKRNEIRDHVMSNLNSCLIAEKNRNICTGALLKDATKEIVTFAAGENIQEQLATKKLPKFSLELEHSFRSCVDKVNPSAKDVSIKVDACNQNYIRKLSSQLAQIKLSGTLITALGQKKYTEQKPKVDALYESFLSCLKQQKKDTQELLKSLDACTIELEEKATALVEANIKRWLATSNDSPTHSEFKAALATAIPCLSGIMPQMPYDEDAVTALDPESVLQSLALTIGNYINYDLEKAKTDLPDVLEKLMKDLEGVGSLEARKELVRYLVERKVLDQLIKSIVKAKVTDGLNSPKAQKALSTSLRDRLLEKKTFDTIFTEEVLATLRPKIADTILVPAIVEAKRMQSPDVIIAEKEAQKQIVEILLHSPKFGDMIARDAVQDSINSKNKIIIWIGSLVYGEQSFDWKRTRETAIGKRADTFIKKCLLRPQFFEETISEAKMDRRMQKAENWVSAAIKNQEEDELPTETCD